MMTLKELSAVGSRLTEFLSRFSRCFKGSAGRQVLRCYVQGQLSDVPRKNCEAIAIKFDQAPRTLQRFLESIKWDEELLRDQCQQIVAREHAQAEAIGLIDESGIHKSGHHTAAVGRQYNGNRGKIENCVVGVHLGYATPGFQVLLDSQQYLPQDWADDPERRKQNYIPNDVTFQTKPQIALGLIDRALGNGVRVAWWTADELYGRDSKFLDGLEQRGQRFVVEIPSDTRVWTSQPDVIREAPPHTGRGRPKQTPRVADNEPPREVRNLVKHSSKFSNQSWQKYLVKETHKGPEVWQVKHLTVWRQTSAHLPSTRQTLLVARNVRTQETKFFLANGVVGEHGVTLRALLRVAFSRWAIEAELRLSKEELGLDHFEVRGWRCIHRHYYLTGLSFLFCSRLRQQLDKPATGDLTVEQVRRSVTCWLQYHDLPPDLRDKKFQQELDTQSYYQRRNAQAIKSHTQTRRELYLKLGFDVAKIKTCVPIK